MKPGLESNQHRPKNTWRSSFQNEGKIGEIYTPANTSVFVERALPAGTRLVEATFDVGTERSASWGPGIALIWPERTIKINLRPGRNSFDGTPMIGVWDGHRENPAAGGRTTQRGSQAKGAPAVGQANTSNEHVVDIKDNHKRNALLVRATRAKHEQVKKYLKEAGIKGASVHTLRHTFATHHVAKGTSLRTVQEALGHQDLKTTSVHVSLAREVMNKELQEHAL